VQVHGSSKLLQTLIAHDLIDEYHLLIFPLMLGSGKKLFGDGVIPAGLQLADTKTSTTGVIVGNTNAREKSNTAHSPPSSRPLPWHAGAETQSNPSFRAVTTGLVTTVMKGSVARCNAPLSCEAGEGLGVRVVAAIPQFFTVACRVLSERSGAPFEEISRLGSK